MVSDQQESVGGCLERERIDTALGGVEVALGLVEGDVAHRLVGLGRLALGGELLVCSEAALFAAVRSGSAWT